MGNHTSELARAIQDFEAAVRADEFSGAATPEDRKQLQDDYNESLEHLTDVIAMAVNDGRP